jgi:hypothetical protein
LPLTGPQIFERLVNLRGALIRLLAGQPKQMIADSIVSLL